MKLFVKIALDIMMTILFIILMYITSTGLLWHEILGLFICGLFFAHIMLNSKWIKGIIRLLYKNNFKSKIKYMFILDSLILLSITLTMTSGILISQKLLPFLASTNYDLWFALHTSSSYISLILISVHLGMHWKYIMAAFRKMFAIKEVSKARTILLRTTAVILVIIGIKTSFSSNIAEKVIAPLTLNKENGTSITSTYNTTEIYDSSKLSTNIKLVSLNTSTNNDDMSLEDYLGRLICTACGKHCSLLYPRCGRGVRQAEIAEQNYSSTIEQNQTESNTQAENKTDTQGDNTDSYDNEIGTNSVFTQASKGGGVLNAFTEFIPLMTIYVAGTYYAVEFIDKRKRR